MATNRKTTKAERFIEDMIRCRSIEFACIGMMVEVDGEMGTILGMDSGANLSVQMTNHLKHGKDPLHFHPTWNVKYFDADGKVIAHFDESKCVFRPDRAAA